VKFPSEVDARRLKIRKFEDETGKKKITLDGD